MNFELAAVGNENEVAYEEFLPMEFNELDLSRDGDEPITQGNYSIKKYETNPGYATTLFNSFADFENNPGIYYTLPIEGNYVTTLTYRSGDLAFHYEYAGSKPMESFESIDGDIVGFQNDGTIINGSPFGDFDYFGIEARYEIYGPPININYNWTYYHPNTDFNFKIVKIPELINTLFPEFHFEYLNFNRAFMSDYSTVTDYEDYLYKKFQLGQRNQNHALKKMTKTRTFE